MIQHLTWRARPGAFFFHVPLGGYRTCVEGAILKAIGTVAGVPDIICIFEGHCYALELKAERASPTFSAWCMRGCAKPVHTSP